MQLQNKELINDLGDYEITYTFDDNLNKKVLDTLIKTMHDYYGEIVSIKCDKVVNNKRVEKRKFETEEEFYASFDDNDFYSQLGYVEFSAKQRYINFYLNVKLKTFEIRDTTESMDKILYPNKQTNPEYYQDGRGDIIKYEPDSDYYYVLKNGVWIENSKYKTQFYDVGYTFTKLNYDEIEKKLLK